MAKAKSETLYVFYQDKLVGNIIKQTDDTLSFIYSRSWREDQKSFELIPSMPLQEDAFGNVVTRAFFENLLPEGHGRDKINILDAGKKLQYHIQVPHEQLP